MKFAEGIKTGVEEGKEKHVPFIKVEECSSCGEFAVTIKVGEDVLHPSTSEHHIQYIDVYGVNADDKLRSITRFDLGRENTVPYVKTHVKSGVFKEIVVLSLCNVHGIWENSVSV